MTFTDSERVKFVELITMLATAFDREVSEPLFGAYELGLDDIPLADLTRAVARATRECEFMPKPAELRRLSGEMSEADRATLAFEEMAKAVSIHGYTRSVCFDDPLINATVRNLGGWEHVCNVGSTDHPSEKFETWLRKDFERVYSALCRNGVDGDACAPLIGPMDRQRMACGYDPQGLHRVPTKLPGHRVGLIRGDVPRSLPAPISALPGAENVGAIASVGASEC